MEIYLYSFIFFLGTLFGSFFNVVIYRLPLGMSVVKPRSSCTVCGRTIPWYENIPLISYLILRGKCSHCGAKFSIRYFLIEFMVGIVFVLISLNVHPFLEPLKWIMLATIASIFICHFFIDLEHHLLLDSLNVVLLIAALINIYISGDYSYRLLGGAIGFFGPFLISLAFLKLRGKVGLGGGDVKLFGVLGLILGPFGVLMNLFLSSFVGSILTLILMMTKGIDKKNPFAFGPYILLVASFQIFAPELFAKISHFIFPD
ncbi:MAG: hypothetical protein CO099_08205 [Bdellovibrio sp. CG_4_9_14_3_um_filter_39_7]|nr:MAG: hypothetical protein CO099_08205 [Bdellovibrio sp. CG_4_9_14_3_um_filter_39_7]